MLFHVDTTRLNWCSAALRIKHSDLRQSSDTQKRDQQVIITKPLCADKLTDKPTDCSSIVSIYKSAMWRTCCYSRLALHSCFWGVQRGEQMSTSYLQRQKKERKQDNLISYHSGIHKHIPQTKLPTCTFTLHSKDWHCTSRSALFIGFSQYTNQRKCSYLCKPT